MKIKGPLFISYSLSLIFISVMITVFIYQFFVLGTFSSGADQTEAFRQVSAAQEENSPIKSDKDIIEVMSLGCHYCAANEENIREFAKSLPAGSQLKTIHITSDGNGLAAYAPLFATLEEMGIEDQYRDSAYNTIITRNVDLSDPKALDIWLLKNNIDVAEYHRVSNSIAVKERLDYMAEVTRYYAIHATPVFIIGRRYVVAQDRDFPAFAEYMRQLLSKVR